MYVNELLLDFIHGNCKENSFITVEGSFWSETVGNLSPYLVFDKETNEKMFSCLSYIQDQSDMDDHSVKKSYGIHRLFPVFCTDHYYMEKIQYSLLLIFPIDEIELDFIDFEDFSEKKWFTKYVIFSGRLKIPIIRNNQVTLGLVVEKYIKIDESGLRWHKTIGQFHESRPIVDTSLYYCSWEKSMEEFKRNKMNFHEVSSENDILWITEDTTDIYL